MWHLGRGALHACPDLAAGVVGRPARNGERAHVGLPLSLPRSLHADLLLVHSFSGTGVGGFVFPFLLNSLLEKVVSCSPSPESPRRHG
jgi:hypothetical protein